MPSVYITAKIPKVAESLLRARGFAVEINNSSKNLTKDELKEAFSKHDAVLTLMTDKIDTDVLKHASKKLKIIANYAIGFDNIDILEARRRGITVTNTPGVASESAAEHILEARRRGITVTNTPGVASESAAEHTFLLILACAKKLIEADKFVRLGKFQRWDPLAFLSMQIFGKTIGIVGLGKIGTFVGQIAHSGFRMKILYSDISRSEDFEILTEAKFVPLQELLKEADIVTLHCPLTVKTYHLIGKEEFRQMKNTAILVNTSRGPVVDEEALISALREDEIAACGLDVYEHEPHVSENLRVLPNVVLTPHSASATVETREAMARIAAENIIDVFEGKEPFGLVKSHPLPHH
ncbi:D-glycerate dehydrogenase [Candidatus Curtissbacteria bacterium]|nr:D-glycerate dehydrogenase [Candidatus Curtissbacteria bacterium]